NKYNNHLLKITSSSPLEIISNIPPSSITIPPMAFIDDTVWHSENPETLQHILNDTQQLYNLNNIKINPTKSDLLYISQNKNKLNTTIPTLYYNNQIILLRKPHEIIQYLGIYFDKIVLLNQLLKCFKPKLKTFSY